MANVLVNDLYLGDIADAIRSKLGVQNTYKPSEMAAAIESISGGSSLGTKNITANGTYNASSDSLDGYSQVTVNVSGSSPSGTKSITANGTGIDVAAYAYADVAVPNTYTSGDEGKVVSNGTLVSQGSDTVTSNGTVDTTLISSLLVSVSGSSGVRKVTGSVVGNGSHTISFSVSDGSPDLIYIYRSDIANIQAVSDRSHCATLDFVGKMIGSMYNAANSTAITNSGNQVDAGIYETNAPTAANRVGYDNGTMYIRSGNNSNLWSTSLTYNYELYYFD